MQHAPEVSIHVLGTDSDAEEVQRMEVHRPSRLPSDRQHRLLGSAVRLVLAAGIVFVVLLPVLLH